MLDEATLPPHTPKLSARDRFGQDVTLEKLPFAERNPKKILVTCGAEDIAENADVECMLELSIQESGKQISL